MPRQFRPRRQATEEEIQLRRTRVTPYQARIERRLVDVYLQVPEYRQASAEWIFTHAIHIQGYTTCDLCGHNPIRRLFFIKHRTTGEEMCLGSECIRNYVSVDLVDAYLRNMTQEQGRIRRNRERAERLRNIRERHEQMRRERSEAAGPWREANADVIAFLEGYEGTSDFVNSLRRWLQGHSFLTESQTAAIRRIMEEVLPVIQPIGQTAIILDAEGMRIENRGDTEDIRVSEISGDRIRTGAIEDGPATVDDAINIPNGTFGLVGRPAGERIMIYTVKTGPLTGKRILKVRMIDNGGSWKGFAFLTTLGQVKMWSRWQNDQHLRTIAEETLRYLRGESVDGYVIQRMCIRCNEHVGFSGRYCTRHGGIRAQRVRRASRISRIEEVPTQVVQTARRTRRTVAPRLSELGSGEIQ